MDFIDRLILELPSSDLKPLMLTLHCLFPNDFLPALDLLDRKLVRRIHEEIFLVMSTSSQTSERGYEVRLHAWNCNCSTFTLAVYRGPSENSSSSTGRGTEHVPYPFGGSLVRTVQPMPPVCKHILACVLQARCPELFGDEESTLVMSVEELAGWCAGWGG